MKAIAKDVDWSSVPHAVKPFASRTQTQLAAGELHDVFAVSVYQRVVFFLVVDSAGGPVFLPGWLFHVVNASLRSDWICNVSLGHGLDLVLGPPFIARDLISYNSLIDLETETVMEFWRYVKSGGDPADGPASSPDSTDAPLLPRIDEMATEKILRYGELIPGIPFNAVALHPLADE